MFYNILDGSFNILISKLHLIIPMTDVAWKCFRCDLSFKDEKVATLHKQISKHSITKIKVIAV